MKVEKMEKFFVFETAAEGSALRGDGEAGGAGAGKGKAVEGGGGGGGGGVGHALLLEVLRMAEDILQKNLVLVRNPSTRTWHASA